MADPQIIDLSSGAERYTFPVTMTERTGRNINNIPVVVGVSQSQTVGPDSGDYVTPDILTFSQITVKQFRQLGGYVDPSLGLPDTQLLWQFTVQVLIPTTLSPAFTPGEQTTYYLWVKATDGQQVIPALGYKLILQ
jgi:hypothetical protein